MSGNSSRRIEQKYLFPAGQKEIILCFLEHACLPDPHYSFGVVSSIYFDTPALFHYNENRNGDFLKSKLRLRWYQDLESIERGTGVSCFLESKNKNGALCRKQRLELLLPVEHLLEDPLSNEQIADLPSLVCELGYAAPGILVPVLLIRYECRRYVEPAAHTRIAVDTDICCSQANETFFPALTPVHLDIGVVETKGGDRSMPDGLKPFRAQLTKSSFSKYARCLEHLMQPQGRSV